MASALLDRLRGWSRRRRIIVGASVAILVIIIIGVGVGFTERIKNAYPNYSRLNYTLADDYSGTDFFDKFDYFTKDGASFLFHGRKRGR